MIHPMEKGLICAQKCSRGGWVGHAVVRWVKVGWVSYAVWYGSCSFEVGQGGVGWLTQSYASYVGMGWYEVGWVTQGWGWFRWGGSSWGWGCIMQVE